jgi:putative flippase GtrA
MNRRALAYRDAMLGRFVLVGLSNTTISYSVFWAALHLPMRGPRATVSQLASYGAGTAWSFVWNRRWTFQSDGHLGRQAARFLFLQAALAATSAALVGLAVDREQLPPTPSWLGVIAVVTVVNFLLSRSWVFS